MSPGCVVSCTAVGPSRPGLTIVARLDATASKYKPQSVGELVNSHDHTALGEIWALAGGGGANTKIAAATAIARNNFIGTPRVVRSRQTYVAQRRQLNNDRCVVISRPERRVNCVVAVGAIGRSD